MDKFTLHVKRHDNGCRVDLVHTDTEYDDDMEGYSNDPAISFHKVDDDENPH